jgi:serine/threonine protein kinase
MYGEEDEDDDLIDQVSDDDMMDGMNAHEAEVPPPRQGAIAAAAAAVVTQSQGHHNNNGTTHNNNNNNNTALDDNEPPLEGYQRTDLIGQGAYGIVYRGTRNATGETVAIKRIPFADSTPEGGVPCNVIREISLLRELDHPNVVKLLDIIQTQGGGTNGSSTGSAGLYLVFEYVAHDLKTFMDQNQTSEDISERVGLPPLTTKTFMKQILAGVGYCHTYRILHRDLKPHNLLISADGQHVKLADFGLARLSAIPNGPYTFEVVTLWYRAPELLLGANRYSTSVDVWSIGCIFAEMATGMPLFPGRSDIDQLFKIFQRRGTPTADVWPAVTRLPHYNPEFPQWKEQPITDYLPLDSATLHNPHQGVDLLTKLLQYDPERRIACKTALQHPYFM